MNGGYAMVDCAGLDLGELGTVTGLYAKTKAAIESEKPLVLSGVVNGEQAFTPMVAYGGIESTTSVFVSFFPVTLHISNADVVTM
jgi:hypothetical protein